MATIPSVNSPKLWDIFCKVIDNYGDIGVCWRLSADLAARGENVRLWVDDASALQWMAPQGCVGVEIKAWTQPLDLRGLTTGNVLIEAFGCEVASEYIANYSIRTLEKGINSRWINLEYLSAEAFVARSHTLPSPVMTGPGAGLTKHFFYPGFTSATGGLLREPDLLARQARFDRDAWLLQFGIRRDTARGERLVSLFCYEPPALEGLLQRLASGPTPTRLLVTHGRSAAAVLAALAEIGKKNNTFPTSCIDSSLSISYLPKLQQPQFDELLWACDLNFVRGEDSLVRAIWAGKPFVWQIYPQSDGAHHAKLTAFLEMMAAPPSLKHFWLQWNSMADDAQATHHVTHHVTNRGTHHATALAPMQPLDLPAWGASARALRTRLLAQTDLTGQLIAFVNGLR